MHRGLEIGIFLAKGLRDEEFVARAIGNLAAYRLREARHEPLEWQVLRIETSSRQHHYRLVIRHPDRLLDLGIKKDLAGLLRDLSDETEEQLHRRFDEAEHAGLRAVPVRRVKEEVDFWQDDFWRFLGGPSGFGPHPPAP